MAKAHRKSILIYRLGSLGDTVVALPCFNLIRQKWPDHRIVLLTNHPVSKKAAPAMEILQQSGLCDEAMAYPLRLRNLSEVLRLRRDIRANKFEMVINLQANRGWWKSLRDELFFRCCLIKRVIGTPFSKKDLVVEHVAGTFTEQEAERLAKRIRKAGVVDLGDPSSWDLHLSDEERGAANVLLDESSMSAPFIVASVGTKLASKDWGDKNWRAVLEQISTAYPDLGLVLLGAPDEFERSEDVRSVWRGPSSNLCGKTSPRVSAGVLEKAALFLGHDSGPMHLAAAAGTHVVAVFSWNNPPGLWYPGCLGWDRIKVFYPPLPGGGWDVSLAGRRGEEEGILLVAPDDVVKHSLQVLEAAACQSSVR